MNTAMEVFSWERELLVRYILNCPNLLLISKPPNFFYIHEKSFWIGNDDLRWTGVWSFSGSSTWIAVLCLIERTQPDSSCLICFSPDVLHLRFSSSIIMNSSFNFTLRKLNSICLQLNIHKFKVVARFGLMHCLATNVCVWVRTLVRESLKEINGHYHHYEKKHKALTKAALAAAAAASAASNNATTTIGNVTTTIVNSVESIIQQVLEDVASSSSPEESTIIDFSQCKF